jgi:hypothetical protein
MERGKFHACGANGNSDPRTRDGSNQICSECGSKFSFWDDLNLKPFELKLKCAKCKGIIIELIKG